MCAEPLLFWDKALLAEDPRSEVTQENSGKSRAEQLVRTEAAVGAVMKTGANKLTGASDTEAVTSQGAVR